jgi:rRNA-processing protein FCF1
MTDRELTEQETKAFLSEFGKGRLNFNALETILNEKTKPSLHDLCINELYAIVKGQKLIIIQLGRDIYALRERIKILEVLTEKKKHE